LELACDPPAEFRKWRGIFFKHHLRWFAKPRQSDLADPSFVLFIDDARNLNRWDQHALLSIIDRPESVVLLATSHWGAIDRSLAYRFGNDVYELRRPDPNDIAATY
jgi:replication-associated recombination protein RarA